MANVLIAGGGVAGSSLAIMLGRRGISVELFERESFPREKPCGEGLMPGGVAVLERMNLANKLEGQPFDGVRYHCGGRITAGRFPPSSGAVSHGRGYRRKYLDQFLFETAASTVNVACCAATRVDGPLIENGQVAGLIVEGAPRRARLAVAADGLHSRLRRALELDVPVARRRLGARCHFQLAAGFEQSRWVDVFVRPGRELYVTPLPNRELLVAALVNAAELHEPVEKSFHRWRQEEMPLARMLEGARQVTGIACASPLSARAKRGVAPGIALMGDAAGFLDPITGGGMTQALMTAELLANYIQSDPLRPERWLWDFDRQRQLLLRDYHRLTNAVLWLADHPTLASPALACLSIPPGLLSHLVAVAGSARSLFGGDNRLRSFPSSG